MSETWTESRCHFALVGTQSVTRNPDDFGSISVTGKTGKLDMCVCFMCDGWIGDRQSITSNTTKHCHRIEFE